MTITPNLHPEHNITILSVNMNMIQNACMFLILLDTIYMILMSNFLNTRINFIHWHKLSPCACRSLCSFVGWYLYHWGVWGGPWWCCLLWKTFLCHVFCRCFCSSHPCLGCMGELCRAHCYCLLCLCFLLSLD